MTTRDVPYCCTAFMICDFDTADVEKIRSRIRDYIAGNAYKYKLVMATTCSGDDLECGFYKRMLKDPQRAAEKALRAEGFKCTRKIMNKQGQHAANSIRLWWRPVVVEEKK